MNELLNFIKKAKEEDLENLKIICGMLIYQLETYTYTDELEQIEEDILSELMFIDLD